MIRGQQQLFNSIFPSAITNDATRRGKRNVLIDERNVALAARYFYYAQIRRFRYDDCLNALEKEFFITPAVIAQRLDSKRSFIKELVANKETLKHLKSEYPQFTWIVKSL